jgi:hypothetical protein
MGSGFKNFTAASVLTASDVNNYLMEQSIMSFASTGARDTQITAPEAGMVAYVRSNDANEGLYTYSSALGWRKGPAWNAPWGYIGYTEVTTNQSASNANILSSTISVVNRRRYQLTAQIPGYFSSVANNNSSVQILVGGTSIAEARMWTSRITSADIGTSIVGHYVATATNTTLAVAIYSQAVIGTNHQYIAAATKPISLLVTDIGPSGAPV